MAPSSTSSSNGSSSSGDEWVPKSQRPHRRKRRGVKRTTYEQVTKGTTEQIGINPLVSTIQVENGSSAPLPSPPPPEHLVADCAAEKSAAKLSTNPEIMETKSTDHSADCARAKMDRNAPKLPANQEILETKSPSHNADRVGPRSILKLSASPEILKSPDHTPRSISKHYSRREGPALSSGSPRGTGITVMASPPQHPPATAPLPTVTPAHPATASQPLPRAFLATSAPQRATAATPAPPPPFVFTARPLNPNPSHASPAHGILYPVATSSPAAANQRRAPHVAVGYPRANAVALPIAPSQQPQVPTQSRLPAAAPRAVVAGVTPSPRPEQPPRGVPIAPQPQPKVNPVPAVALTPSPQPQEQSNAKERESTKEDSATVLINGRKVNLSDSESGSLYALCRSWVRNGVRHEIQPSFVGNVAPLLPRPLPASVVDSRMSGKDKEAENEEPKEEKNDTGEYTAAELLKEHVDRAKKIRAELRKERQSRIERYKQRLALLLPPPSLPPGEPGKHDRRP